MSILGSIGAVVGSTIGSIIGGNKDKKNAKKAQAREYAYEAEAAEQQYKYDLQKMKQQYKYDMKAYNQQNSDNIKFWQMQNSYNSPVEQMKRLSGAGLNPMLVYGTGSVAGNSSGSLDAANVPSMRVPGRRAVRRRSYSKSSNIDYGDLMAKMALISQGEDLEAKHLMNTQLNLENEFKANELFESKVRSDSLKDMVNRARLEKINAEIDAIKDRAPSWKSDPIGYAQKRLAPIVNEGIEKYPYHPASILIKAFRGDYLN